MSLHCNYLNALSWLGRHVSSLDARVIECHSIRKFTDETEARAFVVELSKDKSVCDVELWNLVERFPYGYKGKQPEVEL